jgi:hypothetical protein
VDVSRCLHLVEYGVGRCWFIMKEVMFVRKVVFVNGDWCLGALFNARLRALQRSAQNSRYSTNLRLLTGETIGHRSIRIHFPNAATTMFATKAAAARTSLLHVSLQEATQLEQKMRRRIHRERQSGS